MHKIAVLLLLLIPSLAFGQDVAYRTPEQLIREGFQRHVRTDGSVYWSRPVGTTLSGSS